MATKIPELAIKPLTNPGHIRVLELAPGGQNDPLIGRLEHVEVSVAGYEALSYEWGRPEKTHDFHLQDGLKIPITESLHNALKDLRYNHQFRKIWADGICINQDDLEERSLQVSMMGAIYRKALRVITYIGPESDDSAMAVDFSRILCQLIESGADDSYVMPGDPRLLPASDQRCWRALKSLLLRRWVSRCWCGQEFLLNANLVLMCGRQEIPDWDLFGRVVDYVFLRLLPESLLEGPVEDPLNLAECLSNLSRVRQMMWTRPVYVKLLDLLRASHLLQASDPRDKVYAPLAVAADRDALNIPIDYTCSTEELYILVACRILETLPDTRILYHNLDKKSLDLPSWVPDWSTWQYGTFGTACNTIYAASGSALWVPRVHSTERRLELRGCLIDQVTSFGSAIGPHYASDEHLLTARRNAWLREQTNLFGNLEPYVNGSSMKEVLWRSLIGNMTFYETKAHGDYEDFFDAHIRASVHDHASGISMRREYINAVRRRSRYRCLAATKRGYLGAVPERVKTGDWICMLKGASHLFLIREAGANFTYIGPAYVHGLMNGEALELNWYEERSISLV